MALTPQIFQAHLRSTGLCGPEDRLLLAVSGGLDSMAMWHLFRMSGFTVGVAHMHFQLRDTDADADQQFVEEAARASNTPFHTTRVSAREYARQHKLSIEEAARILRYQWLEDIRSANGYTHICTAHHGDDQAETMLMHLVRGTGVKGLSGIPLRSQQVIRPLLFTDRATLSAYCSEHQVQYREDATNADTDIRRNFIRHKVMPLLRELNPSLIQTMRENAERMGDAAGLMQERSDALLHRWLTVKGDDIQLPIKRITHHKAGRSLLYHWLSAYGFNNDQCAQIWEAAGNSGRQFLSATHRLVTTGSHFLLTGHQPSAISMVYIDQEQRAVQFGKSVLHFEILRHAPGLSVHTSPDTALFDAEKLQWPLTLRIWEKGDYLYPLGLTKPKSGKPGKKKVSDLLVDIKMSIPDKERTPVLMSGDQIIWVAGVRQDGRFAVTGKTTRILRVHLTT